MQNKPDTIMKSLNLLFPVCVFLAMGTFITACSTTETMTGLERSEALQSSMQTVDNDIQRILVQIDAVNSSLEELTRPRQPDIARAFEDYSDNVTQLERMVNNFESNLEEMKENGESYFDHWDERVSEYENPEIRQRSNERRSELGETYDEVIVNTHGVDEAFRKYVSDAREIESYLSTDLTSRGVESIAQVADETIDQGDELRHELRNLQTAIETARIEMRREGLAAL